MNHKITRAISALVFVALLVTVPRAQQSASLTKPSEDRIALYQALLDLTNPWTVMCVAAHPDDEDGTSLTVMRHKYGAHTVSLFSTFGEGGQNAIGPELYEELGAIRARETMAAAEIQGSEPHFLGLKDFGYSKTRDEAFKFWGHEEALRRMVLEIRKLRPDVIITNHSTTTNDHGQHQATALMVVEAFDAAADPGKFPEQLKNGVTTWQVRRLFVRARGNAASAPDAQIVTIDPNERDPVRGAVYAEEALRALQKHATQGPWPKTFAEYANRFRAFSGQQGGTPGQLPMIRYRLEREAKGADSLNKDSHNFLDGLLLTDDSLRQMTPLLMSNPPLMAPDNAFALLNDKDAFAKLAALAKAFHQVHQPRITIPQTINVREDLMDERLNVALALAAGIEATLTPEADAVVPGTPAKFVIAIANHGSNEARLYGVGIHGMARGESRATDTPLVPPGKSISIVRTLEAPQTGNITVPHAQHLYDGREFGEIFTATIQLSVQGKPIQIIRRTMVDVAPLIEITSVSQSPFVITPQTEARTQTLTVHVINHGETAKTWVEVFGATEKAARGSETIADATLDLGPGEQRDVVIKLPQPETRVDLKTGAMETNGQPPTSPPNPRLLIRTRDKSSNEVAVPVVFADARVPNGLRVGYIRGFDFSLPNALNALGVESKELSVDDVKAADLSNFTSVIVDNRVYESKPELIAVNQKLLDYANTGGNLIVFYHKSDEWNPDERRNRPQLAPYKLILGNDRITDEDAPITFIEPEHPLLNTPNKMGPDDFKDWIQERGLYYPREWDPQFHALLQSNDPGEAPLKGGLLVADFGKGHYIYTSMVWYRELRAGVPGAYRMLANMISYGHSR